VSDALGRKNIICCCLFFSCIPTALIPLVHSLQALVFLRFLQGLAVPGIVVVLIAYISEEFDAGAVTSVTASYVGGTVMGGFSGRFITGHAADLLGWRAGFFALAALNLAGALAVLWRLPASRRFVPNHNISAGLIVLRQHLRNDKLMAACALGFCVLFSLVATFTYVNLHLAAPPFGLSSAGLANVFAVYLVGVLVTPMAARTLQKLGQSRALLWALGVSATGLMLTLLPSLGGVVLGLAVCATGVFLCQATTVASIAANTKTGRSLATGMYYMSYYAGGAVGSWVGGLAYEHLRWAGTVAVIALIQVLAATIVLRDRVPR